MVRVVCGMLTSIVEKMARFRWTGGLWRSVHRSGDGVAGARWAISEGCEFSGLEFACAL